MAASSLRADPATDDLAGRADGTAANEELLAAMANYRRDEEPALHLGVAPDQQVRKRRPPKTEDTDASRWRARNRGAQNVVRA